MSSAPVDGVECGAQWTGMTTLDYSSTGQMYCVPGGWQDSFGTQTWRLGGNGSGTLTVDLQAHPDGGAQVQAWGYSDGMNVGTDTRRTSSCDGDEETVTNASWPAGDLNSNCPDESGASAPMRVADTNVQSFSLTCVLDSDAGDGSTHYEVTTLNFRRRVCDTSIDSDDDNLSDCREFELGTDASDPDTDGDGLQDGDEVGRGTDPLNPDTDSDGLQDGDEVTRRTNPLNADTDGDALSDGDEVAGGSDPNNGDDPNPRPGAAFTWSMPATARDGDGDGRIDKYINGNRSADVPSDGRYDVRLDACSGPLPAQYRYLWHMVGPGGVTRTATHDRCAGRVRLEEGPWTVTMKTKRSAGEVAVTQGSQAIDVRNHLIVSLGDSYASGEGNPDGTIHVEGLPDKPKWMHRDCHRSAKAASALAAVELEKATAQSSVTFIHLACSGGTIPEGLLGSYSGAEKDGEGNRPQLTQARDLVNGQKPDAVVLSIGGNDAAFAPIITECIGRINCWKQQVEIEGKSGTLHNVSQKLLQRLTGRYAALRLCFEPGRMCSLNGRITEKPLKVPASKIIHIGYPDLSKGQSGQYCDDIIEPTGGGLRADEYEWADKVVLTGEEGTTAVLTEKDGKQLPLTEDGLNPQIAGMAAHGWRPVLGHYADFLTHGYCADGGSWIRSINQSLRMQNNEKGAFHPNAAGHKNMATHLLPTLEEVLVTP